MRTTCKPEQDSALWLPLLVTSVNKSRELSARDWSLSLLDVLGIRRD